MKQVYLQPLINEIKKCVERHCIDTGCFSRWTFGENRDTTRNEYGCADAANILYTIGDFPSDCSERERWIYHLQDMQNSDTGLYEEATHHTIHTTAHCTAALELFDAKPKYKITALEKYKTKEGLYQLLENEVKWQDNPWRESHKGAGILPCLVNSDMASLEWKNLYFDWMWKHSDADNGFFSFGDKKDIPLYNFMAAGFHYIFNHEAEHRPLRYPEKIIDSCIFLMQNPSDNMLKHCGFIEIDVIYSLTRAMRQTPHRFWEAKSALEGFAEQFINMMLSIDYQKDKYFNDLHCLFGSVCALAELQSALPGKILTEKPLKLVLDRRPFI